MSDIDRLKRRLIVAVEKERAAFSRASRWQKIHVKRFETRYRLQRQLFEIEKQTALVANRLLKGSDND